MTNNNLKIDLVYLWVDGNDPKWQAEKEEWQLRLGIPNSPQTNGCRFIDNQELKYSLRSAQMYAPWINKIFIVTNGQVPAWLDTTHPKIEIVTHAQIMPADALPTFNSEAIETCIANIPGLSEHFLYANDDNFFNKPVTKDYFFDKDGNPILMLTKSKEQEKNTKINLHDLNILYTQNLINNTPDKQDIDMRCRHNIEAYRKSYIQACKEEFKNEFDKTTHCKFRTPNSIQRIIYTFWQAKNVKSAIHKNNKEQIYLALHNIHKIEYKLKKYNPTLICYNDTEKTTPEHRQKAKHFFEKLYFKKSEWEKSIHFEIEPIFESSHQKAIVFAPDNKYCKYFSVALQSLIENSKNFDDYDIVVFDSDITERNKNILYKMLPPNFNLRFFNTNEYIADTLGTDLLRAHNYWSISMYYRIFIPLLMQKYKRVLYLDSDIVINGDIEQFFNIDFEDNEIIAIRDSVCPLLEKYPTRHKHIINELKLNKPQNYFNSGVIMFNIPQINKNGYIEKFKNILSNTKLLFPDQDILNVMFENKTKFTHKKWNYEYGVSVFNPNYENQISGKFKEEYLYAKSHAIIIHYTSSRKPWHSPQEEQSDIFWKYAKNSPFFAEILYSNLKTTGVSQWSVKNLNLKWKIYFTYYKSKLLAKFTCGNKRKHYEEKRDYYKKRVNDIRKFSRL